MFDFREGGIYSRRAMGEDSPRSSVPKIFWLSLLILGAGLGLALGGLWFAAGVERWAFSRPHKIQPGSNPNHFYTIEMQSVSLGAAGQDYIIRAKARLKNGGVSTVNLDARAIKLVDAKENQYLSTFPPDTNPLLIIIPQRTATIRWDFTVPAGALDGKLSLLFPSQQRVLIKENRPLKTQLKEGEFRILQRLVW